MNKEIWVLKKTLLKGPGGGLPSGPFSFWGMNYFDGLIFLGSDDIFQGLGEKSLDDNFLGRDLDGGAETPQDVIYGVYGGPTRKGLNAMSAMEREDYLRVLEFASPAFIEAVLKGYQMTETGATTLGGKIITDEAGKPIRLETGEGIAHAFLASIFFTSRFFTLRRAPERLSSPHSV